MRHRLSKLGKTDQEIIADRLQEEDFDSADIRAIISLRKDIPEADIRYIIKRVQETRNIKEYIIQFRIKDKSMTKQIIRKSFARIVGEENILDLTIKGRIGVLSLNSKGHKLFQINAKNRGMTKRALVGKIIS